MEPKTTVFFELNDQHQNTTGKVRGEVRRVGVRGLELVVEGYGSCNMLPGHGSPLWIELYEGKLRLVVFADINQEDPTHIIDLEDARELARKETSGPPTKTDL